MRHDPRLIKARGAAAVIVATATAVTVTVWLAVNPDDPLQWFGYWSPPLAGIGLGLVLLGFLFERLRGRPYPIITWLLAGVALAAISLHLFPGAWQTVSGERVRAWNVFHYYVGAKYFAELGYHDLYAAALTADDEWQEHKALASPPEAARLAAIPDYAHIERTRDLRSYRLVPRRVAVRSFDRSVFSEERWKEFGEDIRFLRRHLEKDQWRRTFVDLGYNPAPAWNVIGTPLANGIPTDSFFFRLITASDLPLYLLIILATAWAFGPRAAAIGALWMYTVGFNYGRFAGGFLQYDWAAACVVCLCAYRKGWYKTAGAALAWAAMTRVFPGFMVIPIAVAAVRDLTSKPTSGRGPFERIQPRRRRFLAAFGLACGLLLVGSHLCGQGMGTWPSWLTKIATHAEHHPVTSEERIGIARLTLHQPSAEDFWSEVPGPRATRLDATRARRIPLQIIGLLLLGLTLWRRRDTDAMVLMLFAVFLTVTVSRYYATVWILLPLLAAPAQPDQEAQPLPAFIASVGLLLMVVIYFAPGANAGSFFLANYLAVAIFGATCVAFLVHDQGQRSRIDRRLD